MYIMIDKLTICLLFLRISDLDEYSSLTAEKRKPLCSLLKRRYSNLMKFKWL